jgi:hypothetical protein
LAATPIQEHVFGGLKMGKFIALSATVFLASFANAAILTYSSTTNNVSWTAAAGSLTKAVPSGAVATVKIGDAESTYNLTTVASALRDVQVLWAQHGYVAEILLKDPNLYNAQKKNGAAAVLASMDQQQVAVITLTWLQTAPLWKITADFKDSFTKNKSPFTAGTAMATFLDDVNKNGPGENNSQMTIVVIKNSDGTQSLVVENIAHNVPNTQVIANSSENLMHEIFSIWLGVTTDAYLATAQTQLLK